MKEALSSFLDQLLAGMATSVFCTRLKSKIYQRNSNIYCTDGVLVMKLLFTQGVCP